jgi:hypothetical protein
MDPVNCSPPSIEVPDARFVVFTAVRITVQFFWVVTPCNVVVGYQLFRGPLHSEEGGSMDL